MIDITSSDKKNNKNYNANQKKLVKKVMKFLD